MPFKRNEIIGSVHKEIHVNKLSNIATRNGVPFFESCRRIKGGKQKKNV